jgi:hypothetical protein
MNVFNTEEKFYELPYALRIMVAAGGVVREEWCVVVRR